MNISKDLILKIAKQAGVSGTLFETFETLLDIAIEAQESAPAPYPWPLTHPSPVPWNPNTITTPLRVTMEPPQWISSPGDQPDISSTVGNGTLCGNAMLADVHSPGYYSHNPHPSRADAHNDVWSALGDKGYATAVGAACESETLPASEAQLSGNSE